MLAGAAEGAAIFGGRGVWGGVGERKSKRQMAKGKSASGLWISNRTRKCRHLPGEEIENISRSALYSSQPLKRIQGHSPIAADSLRRAAPRHVVLAVRPPKAIRRDFAHSLGCFS